jgi:hypothetical protein
VNDETSAPSVIPSVEGDANESTVHSTNVAFAFCLEADERTGVSSGARIVNVSVKSSRLEILDPCPVTGVKPGLNVSDNAMINYYFVN